MKTLFALIGSVCVWPFTLFMILAVGFFKVTAWLFVFSLKILFLPITILVSILT